MPIISGDVGIKSWSYEILVVSDGVNSWEECEDCLKNRGEDPSHVKFQPIFAETEMDRNPSCDSCGYVSFIFSPTAECVSGWLEMLEAYLVRRQGNTDFLDEVQDHMNFVTDDVMQLHIAELYRDTRNWEKHEGESRPAESI